MAGPCCPQIDEQVLLGNNLFLVKYRVGLGIPLTIWDYMLKLDWKGFTPHLRLRLQIENRSCLDAPKIETYCVCVCKLKHIVCVCVNLCVI